MQPKRKVQLVTVLAVTAVVLWSWGFRPLTKLSPGSPGHIVGHVLLSPLLGSAASMGLIMTHHALRGGIAAPAHWASVLLLTAACSAPLAVHNVNKDVALAAANATEASAAKQADVALPLMAFYIMSGLGITLTPFLLFSMLRKVPPLTRDVCKTVCARGPRGTVYLFNLHPVAWFGGSMCVLTTVLSGVQGLHVAGTLAYNGVVLLLLASYAYGGYTAPGIRSSSTEGFGARRDAEGSLDVDATADTLLAVSLCATITIGIPQGAHPRLTPATAAAPPPYPSPQSPRSSSAGSHPPRGPPLAQYRARPPSSRSPGWHGCARRR